MKRAIWVSAAAALALGGCSKQAGTGAAANAGATATTPAGPTAPPARKAGLWEQKISADGMQQTMKTCLDAATDRKMKWWGAQAPGGGKSDCAEQRVTMHPGGGWDFRAVCAMGQSGTVTSDGSATGDFSSHYTVAATSVTAGSPMPQANGTHKTTIEATWTGPCPADMKPGDMELPGGMRINVAAPNSSTTVSVVHRYSGNGRPSDADIARMRAQAMDMAKAAKGEK
jgi:hypothetical protein